MEIQLTQGRVAVIDDEDADKVLGRTWRAVHANGRWYAQTYVGRSTIRMHRLILNAAIGRSIDHVDGDGLNNRRSNLRLCTDADNQLNTRSRKGSSRYKGVAWHSKKMKWRVAFRANGIFHWVGYFTDEIQAAMAYDNALRNLGVSFARFNFPMGEEIGATADLSENRLESA